MIIKITNTHPKFYEYMGKFFGSRKIQKLLNDRIFDDDNKEWHLYIDENHKVQAFASVCDNILKNIYSTEPIYLEKILRKIQKQTLIKYSIVTNCYIDIYEKCGFKVYKNENFKNFVTIYLDDKSKSA